VRREVLMRDGGICIVAGPTCRGRATSVDHIVPVSLGGARLDPANLRAA
jgi:5-methylcytosine-specific restriction endonuclease McrA